MLTRKLIHRLSFAVAVSVSVSNATNALAFQQYQPGEPGKSVPQGNSTVTQELNRMFQESGQTMPSMVAQELPNANVPIQGQVRLREGQEQSVYPPAAPVKVPGQTQASAPNLKQSKPQPQPQSQAQTKHANTSDKQSFMGRLFGKLRGDTVPNNPNYKPPVPPDFTPGQTKTSSTTVSNQPRSSNASTVSAAKAPQTITAQPNNKTKQPTLQTSNHPRNGATSEIPPRSGATVKAARNAHEVSATQSPSGARTGYTQPGSAPGFMSTAGTPSVIQKQPAAVAPSSDKLRSELQGENSPITVSGANSLDKAQNQTPTSTAGNDVNEDFESPFLDVADANAESDLLDLDSLIEIPPGDDETEPMVSSETPLPTPQVDETAVTVGQTPEDGPQDSSIGPDENPFTGVQLNASDAEFFSEQESATGSNLESVPVTPIEEFQPDLPAMKSSQSDPPMVDLPAVEDDEVLFTGEESDGNINSQPPALDLTVPAASDTAARAELNAIPDVPAAMTAAETEQLKQTAERQRRQQQLRLIQSRSGQTGFKGFCPVELREHRELVEASDRFTSTFGLQTYTFSSAEAKATFDTEPSRYAAAAGGSDVVVLVNSGEEQPGLLDYALWYRDRLYLFRSRETMTLFSNDPQRFASQY